MNARCFTVISMYKTTFECETVKSAGSDTVALFQLTLFISKDGSAAR